MVTVVVRVRDHHGSKMPRRGNNNPCRCKPPAFHLEYPPKPVARVAVVMPSAPCVVAGVVTHKHDAQWAITKPLGNPRWGASLC